MKTKQSIFLIILLACVFFVSSCVTPTQPAQKSSIQTEKPQNTPTLKISSAEPFTKTPRNTTTKSYFALGTVTGNLCNLRNGPGTDFEIVGNSENGDVHEIYGRNYEKTWLLINQQEPVWISSTLIALDTDISEIPIFSELSFIDTPEPVKTPTKTKIVYATKTKATPQPTQDTGCPDGCPYPPPGCVIKGNISFNTGEKIYHLPGGEFYNDCVINPEKGERWFCTEQEAINNGWRKSQK